MKYDIFLKGKTVNLVNVNKKLILKTNFYTWLNDQTITKNTSQGYFPISRKEELEYYEQNIKSKKRIQLGVILKKANKLIGMLSLYNINHFDGCCSISAFFNMKVKKINSLNYFRESQTLMIDHAFKKLNLRRVEAGVNHKSLLKVSQKLFGFTLEGILKERVYTDGKYKDIYLMGLLRKNWLSDTR